MSTNTQPVTVDAIAHQISDAMKRALAASRDTETAKAAHTEKAEAEQGTREGLYVSLAALSAAGNWDNAAISKALPVAIRLTSNSKEKAVSSFGTDARVCMDSRVRDHVERIRALRDSAWELEAAGEKDDPRPLKEAWARKQHALIECLKAHRDGTRMETDEDVIGLAQYTVWLRDRKPDVAMKEVTKALDTLRDVLRRFNMPELQDAIGLLGRVSEESLGEHIRDMPEPMDTAPHAAAATPAPETVNVPDAPDPPAAQVIVKRTAAFSGKAPVPVPRDATSILEQAA